ncbi:MAG: bifunctional acetate--CoA ligase family protein/GNAT family N-acetyltransferase [Microcystaceae cyanobacterium]
MLKPTKPATDPAYDILRSEYQPLSAIFGPETVAVIGATEKEGSVGRTLMWNLVSSPFGGMVFPINPKRRSVLGIRAYPDIYSVPEPVDLAIIATPAPTIPKLIDDCVETGVKGVIIISAGFKEIGEEGRALEQQIIAKAQGKLRIIGPNCLGVMNPRSGLNATFANSMARPGNVGFISQSGAICTAVLDWSYPENVGFSSFISIGSMLDVDWGDLIYYLGDDPHTKSIVIYMESIGNAASFLSAAREVALTKPIIVIKAGETEAAAKAATSHTGALAGSKAVLEAAFRRCGVLKVERISELFDLAEVMAKQPSLPQGSRLTLITNAGGPGVLATDALVSTGGDLAEISNKTINELNEFLPLHWSHSNPIDILGDADPDRYSKTLATAVEDPNSDGLLVILTPQAMTNPTKTAEELCKYAKNINKPILASWMGGDEVTAGELILNRHHIPTYRYPDAAARLFNKLWKYEYNLQGIYETPSLAAEEDSLPNRERVKEIIDNAHSYKRVLLTELESKQVLEAYNIPIVQTTIAETEEEAIALAEKIGYPVVLKLLSETITHKTDVGGVQLNLLSGEDVKWAYHAIRDAVEAEHFGGVTVQPMLDLHNSYELILGSSIDPQFGPVLLFGSGGQLVEVFKDQAIALPPLNTTLARRLMEQTHIYQALKGVRGRSSVDLDALEHILVKFSQLVVEQPWIEEIDINPLLASENRLIALDARIVLHPCETEVQSLPKPAIRPYPHQYTERSQLADGSPVKIRPIRPEDEPLMVKFYHTLSEESVYFRYFHLMNLNRLTAHERLTRLCFIDYDREMALVAVQRHPETKEAEIIAVGRLSKVHGVNEAEFAMLVSDPFQNKGLGTQLLQRLIQVGKDENLERITAEILLENRPMQRVCEKVGFHLTRHPDLVKAEFSLKSTKL